MDKQTANALLPDQGQGPGNSASRPVQQERSLPKMRNDTAASGEFRINVPADVLAEMRRQNTSPRAAMQVDGFRPGILGRLIDLMTGRRR